VDDIVHRIEEGRLIDALDAAKAVPAEDRRSCARATWWAR
jgi:hypothetical protein